MIYLADADLSTIRSAVTEIVPGGILTLKEVHGMTSLWHRPPNYGQHAPRAVVYLYGDPLAAVASHYRREWAFHQVRLGRRVCA